MPQVSFIVSVHYSIRLSHLPYLVCTTVMPPHPDYHCHRLLSIGLVACCRMYVYCYPCIMHLHRLPGQQRRNRASVYWLYVFVADDTCDRLKALWWAGRHRVRLGRRRLGHNVRDESRWDRLRHAGIRWPREEEHEEDCRKHLEHGRQTLARPGRRTRSPRLRSPCWYVVLLSY